MKNLFLLLIFVFGLSTSTYCQDKINTDDLIGYWKPDQESSQLFFWKDSFGRLQMQEICESTGQPIDLITLRVEKDYIFTRTIFVENNWVTENTFTFKDKKTLQCLVTGDGNVTIVYSKVK
jgi:hypothetical protein